MTARLARFVLAGGVAATILLGAADPAGAHTTSGPPASNYHTVVRGITPSPTGVRASAAADEERLELRVTGPQTVVVRGYHGEPYLRVTRHGVEENRSSPAVDLNRNRIPTGPARKGRIPPPHWVTISDSSTVVWHDHRVHWMGGATPAVISRDPDHSHLIERWSVPLQIDGHLAAIQGSIRWDPPPSTTAWWALAVALFAVVLLASRLATRPVALAAVTLLGLAEGMHVWGSWPYSTVSTGGRIGENLPSIAVVGAALVTVWVLARRSVWTAAPFLIITGLFAFAAGGLADIPTLSHAWAPSRLDPPLARTLVAISLGVGGAVAVIGVLRLRAPRPAS